MDKQSEINQLQNKIDSLLSQHEVFKTQILHLKAEIEKLSAQTKEKTKANVSPKPVNLQALSKPKFESKIIEKREPRTAKTQPETISKTFDLEQFVGGNLINKIGIVILLIGLGLFVKYAVDNGILQPMVRVILGYLSSIALIYFAYRFKNKYLKYSAVLFSGGMAVLYFTTYLGYSFFEPPVLAMTVAFYLMLSFTIVTVVVANYFNTQIIGLIGLIGAYAIPFLVNDGSENYFIFFTYISIINLAIVYLAVRNKWELTIRAACGASAFIYLITFFDSPIWVAGSLFTWCFIILNFIVFQFSILYFLLKSENNKRSFNYTFLYLNAIAFYLFSIILVGEQMDMDYYGEITFVHAVLHFGLAYLFYKKFNRKDIFWNLTFFASLFFTIAIPIEFNLETTIVLWSLELLGLIYVARKFKVSNFEFLMWFLLALNVLLIICQWALYYYDSDVWFTPLFNKSFLATCVGLFALFGINRIEKKMPISLSKSRDYLLVKYLLASGVYFLFFSEVYHLFKPILWENVVGQPLGGFMEINHFRGLALLVYSMLFVSSFYFLGKKKWDVKPYGYKLFYVSFILSVLFMSFGMYSLNYLRGAYFEYEESKIWFLLARYICYLFFFLLVYVLTENIQENEGLNEFSKFKPLILHVTILVILSHEVITIISLYLGTLNITMPYREGLSILWGMYSFVLIGLGMDKDSKILRVGGMVLFGVTLIKVFLYDLAGLSIVSRIVIFIGLGVLLLITSYLYQRKSVAE